MNDLVLAIDTSTDYAGLALYDGLVRTEWVWRSGRQHSRQLMPAIERSLELVGASPRDVAAVVAARGPGSFTGVRVGLAVARGLAFSLGKPLFGIPSLEIIAASQATSPWPVRAVIDAGRGRFATAEYVRREERWIRADGIVGVHLDELVRLVRECAERGEGRCVVAGDLTCQARSALAALGERVCLVPPASCVRRPAVLAELGWWALQSGETPGAEDGEPIYLTRT